MLSNECKNQIATYFLFCFGLKGYEMVFLSFFFLFWLSNFFLLLYDDDDGFQIKVKSQWKNKMQKKILKYEQGIKEKRNVWMNEMKRFDEKDKSRTLHTFFYEYRYSSI